MYIPERDKKNLNGKETILVEENTWLLFPTGLSCLENEWWMEAMNDTDGYYYSFTVP